MLLANQNPLGCNSLHLELVDKISCIRFVTNFKYNESIVNG